jgi:hypothetical protein
MVVEMVVMAYGILFPYTETLVEHGLLCLHLLQVPRRVGVHLSAIRRRGHAGVRLVHLALSILGHIEVEEVVCAWGHAAPAHGVLRLLCARAAIVLAWWNLRTEVIL